MSGQFQIFEPGKYFDWEKAVVEERLEWVEKGPPENKQPPVVVDGRQMLHFNHNWDPLNPLFNKKEYAQQAGYQDVPAWPCYQTPMGAIMLVSVSAEVAMSIADQWLFAHGPNDVEFFAPIYPGDTLTTVDEKLMFVDQTVPGSELRHFKNGCVSAMYNQKGELVIRHTLWRREAYKKVIDGSPAQPVEQPQPKAHFTTDGEWEYIEELWDKEYIRGKDTLYWEDVNVGDEPTWVCSGPVTHMDMARCYGDHIPHPREFIRKGMAKMMPKDPYGQILVGVAPMYGGQNIPGRRAMMYNDTAAKNITRLVTNYVGDAGFVTRIGWMFFQTYPEMRYPREGGEYLDQVPYMKGKGCTDHPTEADTVIAKGYVTNKYVNDRGEHIIDLVCWGETLDKRIIEVVPAAAKLPSKGG